MKAKETRLLEFISNAPQFIIPIYQRNYSWTEAQCRQLWNDIVRAGTSGEISGHFIGSIVYIEEGLGNVSLKAPLLIIDGQQRLATVTLLLAALRDAVGDAEPVEGFSAAKIAGYYLQNNLESGDRRYKLLLSDADRASLLHILGAPEPLEPSPAIEANYKNFKSWIAELNDIASLCVGLQKLLIVDIALSRGQDNPQLIFESMNSTGMELTQADLIRNYLLMDLPAEQQRDLYDKYWRPMEISFGTTAGTDYFDAFIRHYLSFRTGLIPKLERIYAEFKIHAQKEIAKGGSVADILADIQRFSRYYGSMALRREPDGDLREMFANIVELKANVAYPMLLEWYDDYSSGKLCKADFLDALRLVESYVFRRAVCEIAANSLNKTFLIFNRGLDKDRYLDSVRATFMLMPSYKRFPDDGEFAQALTSRNMYNNRRAYWTRRLENHGRKEPVNTAEYTVEHIMPQDPKEWQAALGPEWRAIHEKYLNNIGNLTLTGYNSEYRNKPFLVKRDMEGGFKESPLHLNKGLGQLDKWDGDAIEERAKRLSTLAIEVWPAPNLDKEKLKEFLPESKGGNAGYTIDHYPHLSNDVVKSLFEALRKEILALDPAVTEEFLKLYVAYKAETNFVDIIPLAKSLRLSLNMKFPDITDPRGICRDITAKGRWGNGDVEVYFKNLADLPYVMGLIRQSLDQQIAGS